MRVRRDSTPFVSASRNRGRTQYVYFGGKGGNGKTTCAAAAAVALAEHGRKVLVVSTDPAHSLGDVLEQRLTSKPSDVGVRQGVLSACELDADRALARWLARRRPQLATIFQRGTILERRDIDRFLSLSLPGIDELFGLLEIERLATEGAYDQVVVDTAPTGHTLRLLATPALFTTFARVLDAMQEKHRVLASVFGGGGRSDLSDALIEELRQDGDRLHALLRDRLRTRLCWTLLPEQMSMAESSRALASLQADGIHASDIIVNRITPPPPSPCALCDGRRHEEAEWLNAAAAEWPRRNISLWTVIAREEPPQGVADLRELARSVSRLVRSRARATARRKRPKRVAPHHRPLPSSLTPSRSTRLLIVGGKGGVGKTTCAASLALTLARAAPDRRVLLASTDPAHSIGDVLGEPIGDVERRIRAGDATLFAREIDAAQGWKRWCARYRQSVKRLFERLGGEHADLSVDRAIVEQLFELAPPGMDEIAGMLVMMQTLTRRESPFDVVVVDSAPTGHTRRLLELPAQARAWTRQLMAVVLKYHLAGIERVATDLVWLSQGLTAFEKLLTDARACGFVIVTRPEQLPALETLRLVEWLREHRIARRALIVNGLTPPGCARCRRTTERERRQIASFTRRAAWKRSGCATVLADAVAPPPRGPAALIEWAHTWR